jgi:DNA-binding response OmpR family regulator
LARILVVEDELMLGLYISQELKDEGYDVITVADAGEAIQSP